MRTLIRIVKTMFLWRRARFLMERGYDVNQPIRLKKSLEWFINDIGLKYEDELSNLEIWFLNEATEMYYSLEKHINKRILLGSL